MTDADHAGRIDPAERVAFETRIRELEGQLGEVMGQAYQIIGVLTHEANLAEHPELTRVLDYFAANEFQDDFLPVDFSSLRRDGDD